MSKSAISWFCAWAGGWFSGTALQGGHWLLFGGIVFAAPLISVTIERAWSC